MLKQLRRKSNARAFLRLWFKSGNRSFPSGEVAEISSIITPYVLEYRHDHPGVVGARAPAYDAVARMKVQAHWQTDVLAGFARSAPRQASSPTSAIHRSS